jgi:flagellar hook-associated protein 3 FlgL
MIVANTKSNINANKVNVDKYNTQMTTQKKINKPSENPVIAIRSLRMQTTLTHIDQYLDNNIADANAWLEVTDTALKNMTTILESIRTQCVDGATDTLKQDNRRTILQQLEQMADQVYSEGNADYAGRTVFTGYRTTSQLTFQEDETKTTYEIDQKFSYKDLTEERYYYGAVETPDPNDLADATKTPTLESVGTVTYERLRLAYGNIKSDNYDPIKKLSYTINNTETTVTPKVYASESDWENDAALNGKKELGNDQVIFIQDTGELIIGEDLAKTLKDGNAEINVTYIKQGFSEGEARPEYYYDCRDLTAEINRTGERITYEKEDQPINYEISSGIYLAANTQASEVLDTSIGREVTELINIVSAAINAHDTVDEIQEMLDSELYQGKDDQAKLQKYKEAAQKVADYADDNMQKAFSQGITDFNSYLEKVNIAHTNVGCKQDRLSLTKTRVENQKETVEELKTENDNREISDIIIDYYAAYNAYTASLTAASKVNSQTLLNYI